MTQPIAGVSPSSLQETTTMVVWPGITRFAMGRFLGGLYDIGRGGYIVTAGNLIALLTAPLGAALYLFRIAPGVMLRYRLTNRRIIAERDWSHQEEKSVDLDRFDAIDVAVRPGQRWFDHGDLVFRSGNVETFRLAAVPRPQQFKAVCWKARMAYVSVREVLRQQRELEPEGELV